MIKNDKKNNTTGTVLHNDIVVFIHCHLKDRTFRSMKSYPTILQ